MSMPSYNSFWMNTKSMHPIRSISLENPTVRQPYNPVVFLIFKSSGGHYLPALSSEIIKRNREAAKKGLVKINYQSMLIGNGWTDPRIQYRGYATYGCTGLTECKALDTM